MYLHPHNTQNFKPTKEIPSPNKPINQVPYSYHLSWAIHKTYKPSAFNILITSRSTLNLGCWQPLIPPHWSLESLPIAQCKHCNWHPPFAMRNGLVLRHKVADYDSLFCALQYTHSIHHTILWMTLFLFFCHIKGKSHITHCISNKHNYDPLKVFKITSSPSSTWCLSCRPKLVYNQLCIKVPSSAQCCFTTSPSRSHL